MLCVCVCVLEVWNAEEREQTNVEKEEQSESVPELQTPYTEEEDEQLSKKMEALTVQDKGVELFFS